jgi:GT2 family glycosyltransferase
VTADIKDSEILRPAPKIHLVWTTPVSTFQLRNHFVLQSYFYHHPDAHISIYASHLPLDFFQTYSDAGYDIDVKRLDDSIIKSMGAKCLAPNKNGIRWTDRLSEWKEGPFYYSHITDFIRFCLLYIEGGVYSDFDALLLRSLDIHEDFIGKDSSGANGHCSWCLSSGDIYLAPGLMGGRKHSPLAKQALRIGFDPDRYNMTIFNGVGPMAVTKAFQALKNPNIYVYDPEVFYPVKYTEAGSLLEPRKAAWAVVDKLRRTSISLHFYGHCTRNLDVHQDSVLKSAHDRFQIIGDEISIQGETAFEAPFGIAQLPSVRIIATNKQKNQEQSLGSNICLQIEAQNGAFRIAGNQPVFQRTLHHCADTIASLNAFLTRIIYRADSNASPRDTVSVTLLDDQTPITSHSIAFYQTHKLVTIIIKTFGRMDKVFELVRSIREMYPFIPMIVANDDETRPNEQPRRVRDFHYIPLPYDIGLSAGRNHLLSQVETNYFLTLDDDFEFNDHSALSVLLHALESGEIDIAAGKNPVDEVKFGIDFCGRLRIDKDRWGTGSSLVLEPLREAKNQQSEDHDMDSLLDPRKRPLGDWVRQCQIVDFVPNLFMARTSVIRDYNLWDESLKLGEHEDFFLRAKSAGIRVATCPTVSFVHRQVPHWERRTAYDRARNRVYTFWQEALKKHQLQRLVSFGTVMMDLMGTLISFH